MSVHKGITSLEEPFKGRRQRHHTCQGASSSALHSPRPGPPHFPFKAPSKPQAVDGEEGRLGVKGNLVKLPSVGVRPLAWALREMNSQSKQRTQEGHRVQAQLL